MGRGTSRDASLDSDVSGARNMYFFTRFMGKQFDLDRTESLKKNSQKNGIEAEKTSK